MSASWKRRFIIIGLFVLGVLFIALARQAWMHELLGEIAKEVGVALMIAAVLGGTFDSMLKIDLVRDAFVAAFSYPFHPALQGEILRIMRYSLICEKHFLRVRIEKIDSDTVRVTCEVSRRIKNIGSSAERMSPHLGSVQNLSHFRFG
jgi:hypothetical protein